MSEKAQIDPRDNVTRAQVHGFVERVERLLEDKKAVSDEIKDVFAEAKGQGFDVKALRTIIKERAEDADKRAEQEAINDLYRDLFS